MDKTLRNTIIAGVTVVSLCAVYYFVIKPEMDKKAYKNCVTLFGSPAYTPPAMQTSIDNCVKSGGFKFVPYNKN